MKPLLTIIMCAYNEIGRIQAALDDLLGSLKGRSESAEVIILDNGSTDGTREWLAKLRHPGLRVELNEKNIGKGGSIKKGFALSRGQYLVIHDPDMEYRAKDIWRLLEVAIQTRASLALGSRVLGGEVQYKYPQNYIGVLVLTRIICLLYGCSITDAATAMKLIDGDLARSLRLECQGFDLDFELIACVARLGGSIREIPIDYYPRTIKEGKKIRAWRDGFLALRTILRSRLRPCSHFLEQIPLAIRSSVEGPRTSRKPIVAPGGERDLHE